ncbi:PDR/VanB family oxidoreductase [Ramlibacter sp. AN1015]|uniref:PDR/VanB family oxidoreductase n=1 Tax=Ramlibacter sp. AN1015 TaxID=3133428 RepID=UPI0030BF2B00
MTTHGDDPGLVTLALRLDAIRRAADGIHLLEFVRPDGAPLPPFTAGAHVDLHLPGGLVRQYSLCNPPHETHRWELGVKRDAASRGGSRWLHEDLRVGSQLQVGLPRNHFPLHEDAASSVLIAGGIGITPLACMAQRLQALGRPFALHYGVRQRQDAALLDRIDASALRLHVDAEHGGAPLDVARVIAQAPAEAHLYCCGPGPMLDAFEAAARAQGRPADRVHLERFAPVQPAAVGGGYTVRLARAQQEVEVPAGQTILEALRLHGIEVPASCEQGICGTCETRVLSGTPDHRDSLLSDEERSSNRVMMICCSGSRDPLLVLDL